MPKPNMTNSKPQQFVSINKIKTQLETTLNTDIYHEPKSQESQQIQIFLEPKLENKRTKSSTAKRDQ